MPKLNDVEFDRIVLKHHNKPYADHWKLDQGQLGYVGYRAPHAALVKGGVVYVGVAKTNPKDQFNRKLGRKIALGRAFFEYQRQNGLVGPRPATRTSRGFTQWAKKFSTPEELSAILGDDVFLREPA